MTKRRSFVATFAFVLAVCLVLVFGITLFGGTLTAYAEGEAPSAEVVEYEITVYNGKATDSEGNEITKAAAGTVVTVIAANWTDIGWAFVRWETYDLTGTEVEIAFEDATSATTTFIMPACNVGVLGMQRKDVKAISVDKTEITMSVGETAQITATVDPIVLAIEVEWHLSNEEVVAAIDFDEDYKVKGTATVTIEARSVGTVTVTAVLGDMSATCTVNVTHTHEFSTEWSKNETKHWHAATCGHEVKGSEEEHTFGEGVITKEATEETAGEKTYTCNVCGYEKKEEVGKLEHVHKFAEEWSKNETKHWHAATCGHEVKGSEEEHTFGEGVITKEATEETTGEKTYTCNVCGYEKKEVLPPLGHTHKLTSVAGEEATCQKEGKKAYYVCKGCGIKFKDEAGLEQITEDSWIVIPAAHNFGEWIEEVPATAKTEGVKAHKDCTVCKKHFDKDGKEIENLIIEKLPSGGGEDKPSDKPTIPENEGLSGGAIAGIVIGGVAVVGIGGFAIFWFAISKKSFAELIAAIKALFKKK